MCPYKGNSNYWSTLIATQASEPPLGQSRKIIVETGSRDIQEEGL